MEGRVTVRASIPVRMRRPLLHVEYIVTVLRGITIMDKDTLPFRAQRIIERVVMTMPLTPQVVRIQRVRYVMRAVILDLMRNLIVITPEPEPRIPRHVLHRRATTILVAVRTHQR